MKFFLLIALAQLSFCVYPQDFPVDSLESAQLFPMEKEFNGMNDTVRITSRSFPAAELDKLITDPELNYEQPPTIAESLWDRFVQWLAWIFENLFGKAVTADLGRLLIYILAGILLIVAIMMLLKVNAFKVLYSGADQPAQKYNVFHENIHEMDFEKLIREATDKKEFRLATRLIFLYALKLLSDKHLIEFKPGKTNHDFVEEVNIKDLKTDLNELSFYFEYTWYGNFSITDFQFQKINNVFTEFCNKIR